MQAHPLHPVETNATSKWGFPAYAPTDHIQPTPNSLYSTHPQCDYNTHTTVCAHKVPAKPLHTHIHHTWQNTVASFKKRRSSCSCEGRMVLCTLPCNKSEQYRRYKSHKKELRSYPHCHGNTSLKHRWPISKDTLSAVALVKQENIMSPLMAAGCRSSHHIGASYFKL